MEVRTRNKSAAVRGIHDAPELVRERPLVSSLSSRSARGMELPAGGMAAFDQALRKSDIDKVRSAAPRINSIPHSTIYTPLFFA